MKTSSKNSTPRIILFWSVPSLSQINTYKANCDQLQKACVHSNSVQVLNHKKEAQTFKKIIKESDGFYGLRRIKGEIRKMMLNVNSIKTIILL
ncbi:hypothetical protein [Aestuariivivens sediminicola]|uniref:hypothetical protein n=1 Tax=Aestuariivivens sediminicola TaxID=2913560 RepID=UPI001F589462|nr:hypothetical protein [Aestuariivivens sediminicola]